MYCPAKMNFFRVLAHCDMIRRLASNSDWVFQSWKIPLNNGLNTSSYFPQFSTIYDDFSKWCAPKALEIFKKSSKMANNCGENDENSCWILFSARISVNRLVHHYILVNKFLITTWKTNIFLESNEWFSAWWIFLLDVRKNVKLLDQAENEFFVSNWSTKLISNHCMIHNHTKENVLFIPSPQNFYVM